MKKVTLAVAALALTASVSSFAAITGTYAGLGLGSSRLDTPDLNPNYSSYSYTQSRGGLGARVFMGHNFNQYLGAEMALNNYAQSKYTITETGFGSAQAKYNMKALDLVAKAYLPVADSGFNFYALGGAALVSSQVKISEQDDVLNDLGTSTTTTRKIRPMVGVGASFDVNKQVTTSLEYSHIQGYGDVKTSNKAIPNADMLSLNVSYNFG